MYIILKSIVEKLGIRFFVIFCKKISRVDPDPHSHHGIWIWTHERQINAETYELESTFINIYTRDTEILN
jgi:hypothetical protein